MGCLFSFILKSCIKSSQKRVENNDPQLDVQDVSSLISSDSSLLNSSLTNFKSNSNGYHQNDSTKDLYSFETADETKSPNNFQHEFYSFEDEKLFKASAFL